MNAATYRKMLGALAAMSLFAATLLPTRADTHYVVKDNAGASSPFTSWTTAASNIQQAIDDPLCVASDVVLVTNGVYDTGGRTNAYVGNTLTNRVIITNAAITVRALSTNPADTLIVGASYNGTNGPAAIRCVAMTKGNLTGFTLTNGHTLKTGGDSLGNDRQGGGLFSAGATIVISNCVFVGNGSDGYSAVTYGGGAIFSGSKFYNCTIARNTCDIGSGGGAAGGTYWNCSIVSNIAGSSGGGLFNVAGVYGCEFIGNTANAGSGGGGLYTTVATGDAISNCIFRSNAAVLYGGGVRIATSAIRIRDTVFDGNQAGSIYIGSAIHGGNQATCVNCEFRNHLGGPRAIYQVPYMTNCLIVGNGHVFYDGAKAINTTIAGNTGDVFYTSASSLTNCIVYGNGKNLLNGLIYNIGYSCVNTSGVSATITVGGTIVTNDPMFADSSNGNYRLSALSPCINTGTNQEWMATGVDLDDRRRLDTLFRRVDMGAYEYIFRGTMFAIR